MAARGKPAPDLFSYAGQRLGAPPSRCLVIEDSPVGSGAARCRDSRNWLLQGKSLRPGTRVTSGTARRGDRHCRYARPGDCHGEALISPSQTTPLTCWQVWNPAMPVFGIDGLGRCWERRIGEGAHRDRHHFRFAVGVPVHCRPTTGTEVEGDRIPAVRCSNIGHMLAGHRDVFTLKEGGNPIGATGSSLALETMAQRDASRIA
jgi:hypothetical protein